MTVAVITTTPVRPQPTGLPLGWVTVPAGAPPAVANNVLSELRCNNVQQFNSLPVSGYPLTSFSVVYSPALSGGDDGVVRVGLYTVGGDNSYTLVASTSGRFADAARR